MANKNKTTKSMTIDQLRSRAETAEREVATLRAEQSDAILAGRDFDPASIRAAEDIVTATSNAIRELERRLEEQARAEEIRLDAVTEQEKRETALKDIKDAAQDREIAIDSAETAARTFMAEYTRAEAARARLQSAIYGLTRQIPNGIAPGDQERRISRSFSAILLLGLGKSKFGDMTLKPGLSEAAQPWSAAEKQVAVEIEQLLADTTRRQVHQTVAAGSVERVGLRGEQQ